MGDVLGLEFEYICVQSKDEYLSILDKLIGAQITCRPLVIEMIVNAEDEDVALNLIGSIMVDESNVAKATIKKIIGKKKINTLKK